MALREPKQSIKFCTLEGKGLVRYSPSLAPQIKTKNPTSNSGVLPRNHPLKIHIELHQLIIFSSMADSCHMLFLYNLLQQLMILVEQAEQAASTVKIR
ncbi:putative Rhodanese like protein [Corchorus olitorius]|uniref:Rhodanese like protein n=1 Tax=Corchorus olitorius TaxID=93759 RepID=A0A1R3G6A4_9ROSI|nr:putative Rhodanese like protein [Corchorus olitorius]